MRRRTLPLLVVAVLLGGCTTDAPDPVPVAATASPPVVTPAPGPRVDWDRPSPVTLSPRLALGPCEGDAPLVCVRSGGRVVGTLELLRFPLASLPALRGTSGRALLEAHAAAYVEAFRADRQEGCGDGYRLTPLPTRVLQAADGPLVSYGFTGTSSRGDVSEEVLQYAGVRGTDLVVLSAPAYEASGCLPPEEVALDVATLRALRPLLDRAVAGSPLA